jgi:D-alanine-D-alanine ligase
MRGNASSMRAVAVVHGRVAPDAPPDEQDTLVQVTEISARLTELGWRPVPIPVDLNLQRLADRLRRLKPAFAFNLVESLDSRGSLIGFVPQLLESLAIPYTGCSADAIAATASKLAAKRMMAAAGIDTPAWIEPEELAEGRVPPGRFIVKSVWEHASIGLDASSIGEGAGLQAIQRQRRQRFGGEWFAEAFVDGREFNLSLVGGSLAAAGPRLLPPAEIEFIGFAPDQPRLVDYAAKWDAESHAYRNTPRRYDFAGEKGLLTRLERVARRCWKLFRLSGCARIDFRVDGQGRPFVLEVNANPCLSSDAGLMAAAARVGWTQADLVREIVSSLQLEPAVHAAVG